MPVLYSAFRWLQPTVGLAFLGGLLAYGCASAKHEIRVARVGPAFTGAGPTVSEGALVVYSARDPNLHFADPPLRDVYTGYKVFGEDGHPVAEWVRNAPDNGGDGPRTLGLPAGSYEVRAQAPGYGWVTVPVAIVSDRTTVVRLDGGDPGVAGQPENMDRVVRLPDGRIVGWKARGAAVTEYATRPGLTTGHGQ